MALGAFFARLKQGLARSTQKLTEGIASIIRKRRLDDAALEELEELLVSADLGPAVAARIIGEFRRTRFGKEVTPEEIRAALAEELSAILAPVAQEMPIDPALKPQVVLVVGVNGTGKTTTIGKLAQMYREQGKRVVMVAGDTFRAAAVEQLQVWGQRTGCEVIAGAAATLQTHSPIVMAYPDSQILLCSEDGITPIAFEDTEHYFVTREFVTNRERMLRHLLPNLDGE